MEQELKNILYTEGINKAMACACIKYGLSPAYASELLYKLI